MKKIIVSVGLLSFCVAFGMPNSNNFDESKINSKRSSFIMDYIHRAVSGIFGQQDDSLNDSEDIFYDCEKFDLDLKDLESKEREEAHNQLISRGFFNVGFGEIQESIRGAFALVKKGKSDSETKAKEVVLFIKREFDWKRVNDGFHNQMIDEVSKQEIEYQRLLEEKDKEIERLRARLNEVLRGEAVPSDLEFLEQQRQETEERINKLKNNRQEVVVKDPLTLEKVHDTVDNIDKKLEKLMNRVQRGRMDLNDAIEDTQDYLSDQIGLLGERFDMFRISTERELRESHEREIEALSAAYDKQLEILQQMIDVSENLRRRAERETRLKSLVFDVIPGNIELIHTNARTVNDIEDIYDRRLEVESLYAKLSKCRPILAETDLELNASVSDLDEIKNWLDKTSIDVVLDHYKGVVLTGTDSSFDGKTMSKPLTEEKNVLDHQFLSHQQESQLAKIALNRLWNQTVTADDSGYSKRERHFAQWDRHKEDGWKNLFFLNGQYRGGQWDAWHHDGRCRWSTGWYYWGHMFDGASDPHFIETSRQRTFESVKRRAWMLFDFETNPQFELQKFYRQVGIEPKQVIQFPQEELARLISQYNEFIMMTV